MLRVIGLMSGTSLDGVDAAWLETDGERIGELGPRLTLPYDDRLRSDLRRLLDHAPTMAADDRRVKTAAARLTEYHARAVAAVGRPADLLGFHGQTILHRPARSQPERSQPGQCEPDGSRLGTCEPDRQRGRGRTWQIGDAAWLAWRTGVRVAWDFRSADVAAGGEGAPLAPVSHAALARALPRPLAVLNIGGVANVTWIGGDGSLLACDTGPGNGPLDDWMARHTGAAFDADGALAREGAVDQAVLGRLLADPYFARPAPKSLDRLDFARTLAASGVASLSPADGAATLVAFSAAAVAATKLPAPPLRWLIGGGGRRNPVIMAALRDRLDAPVDPVEAVGWDGDALEAQCFGFLAARVASGLPLSFPGTTGVSRPLQGGQIADP
jgi:anhydro-N-acetylmuramic acid kinase